MKLKKLAQAMLGMAALVLPSCIQSDQKTLVNPDGSGKFTFSIAMDMAGLMAGLEGLGAGGAGKEQKDPLDQILKDVVKKSKGVDVWKRAEVVKEADGKSKVVLEGYFKSLEGLSLGMGDGNSDFGAMTSKKDAEGNWVLDMSGLSAEAKGGDAEKPAAGGKAEKPMTDAEVSEKVEQMKLQMGMVKGMMEQMMGTAKMDVSVVVAGEIKDYGLFENAGKNEAKISMKPVKMFDAIESMLEDKDIAKLLVQGEQGDPTKMMQNPALKAHTDKVIKAMVGRDGKPRLIIKAGEPLFDYAKEVEAARAGQSKELKDLIEGKEPAPKGEDKVKLPKAA